MFPHPANNHFLWEIDWYSFKLCKAGWKSQLESVMLGRTCGDLLLLYSEVLWKPA